MKTSKIDFISIAEVVVLEKLTVVALVWVTAVAIEAVIIVAAVVAVVFSPLSSQLCEFCLERNFGDMCSLVFFLTP